MCTIKFPINPFPSVVPEDFDKDTKKKYTEDYVDENLRSQGWRLYEPFVDKGYDRIAVKEEKGVRKIRFIQVKARALKPGIQKKSFAGYTITTKDLIPDPRIVFILFSHQQIGDNLVRDILLFPIVEWIKFMRKHNENLFPSLGFKQGDGKFNHTYYQPETKKWTWHPGTNTLPTISLDNFVNKKGLNLMENTSPEDNFMELQKWITKFKNENIYNLRLNKRHHPVLKKPENHHIVDRQDEINNQINIKNITADQSKLLIKSNNEIFNKNQKARDSADKYFGNLEKKILDL